MDYNTRRELQSIAAKAQDNELVYDPTLPGWREPTKLERSMIQSKSRTEVEGRLIRKWSNVYAQTERISLLSSDSTYQSTLTKSDTDCIYCE